MALGEIDFQNVSSNGLVHVVNNTSSLEITIITKTSANTQFQYQHQSKTNSKNMAPATLGATRVPEKQAPGGEVVTSAWPLGKGSARLELSLG